MTIGRSSRHRISGAATFLVVASTVLFSPAAQGQPAPVCVPPPSGLVSWWPGDGNTQDITDGNVGTIVGGVAFSAARVLQGFNLNGSNAYVQVANAPNLQITSQITLDAWINPTATGGRVIDKITAGGADGYMLDTLAGKTRLIIGGTSVSGATTIPTGSFTHVAGTYDGTTLRVYFNGSLDGSLGFPGAIPSNALPLRIGADSTGANLFSGLIDEVEVFNRALTQPEINAIVLAGSAGKCKTVVVVPTLSGRALAGLALLLAAAAIWLLRRSL
jgi:concanavalin A-like lectin/glucanase superfamily protein